MDIHTLHVEHTFLLAVYVLLTVVNARMHKGIRGIHWFSLYNVLLLMGALLVMLRGHVPNFLSIVGGNLFVVSGYVALFVSLTQFFGTQLRQIYFQLFLFAFAIVTMLEFGWLHPDTPRRLLCYSIVLGAQQAHIALFINRRERRDTHAAVSMTVMVAALAVLNFQRILTVSVHGAPQNYLSVQGGLIWMVLFNTALQCGVVVSYVWMTASLLRGDLAVQASTDPLTGLLNRRAMDQAATQVLAAVSAGYPASAIVIDLDDFKIINDSFGHSCGDAILTAVAESLQFGLRHSDFIGRLGGDEFVALLPNTSAEIASEISRKLDHGIRSIQVAHGDQTVSVSASFGYAQADSAETDWGHLLIECDKLLYLSKKNRVREIVDSLNPVDSSLELPA